MLTGEGKLELDFEIYLSAAQSSIFDASTVASSRNTEVGERSVDLMRSSKARSGS